MYNHSLIEKKWLKIWEQKKIYKVDIESDKPKYFALNEFPYPSGAALHMGHALGWSFIDVHSRYKHAKGFNVLCPCGWDSFGLPAEQFAIKNNKDPNIFTQQNIVIMRNQIKQFCGMIDWDFEIDATDPKYYAGTQWIFAQLVKNKLAELKDIDVNWCEQLHTVLANDEIIMKDNKMYSERGEYPVIKKPLKQWAIEITKYAKKLSETLDDKTWPSANIQKQWIGLSDGAIVNFKVEGLNKEIEAFTTRIDTIFGVSFIVIAPENEIVKDLINKKNEKEVVSYIEKTKQKTELERKENKEKTGVFLGLYAINPFNNKKVPIYISDYVLNNYATGMVMGVPSLDKRDKEFATKYNLPFIEVVEKGEDEEENEKQIHINSDFLNGLNKKEAIKKAIEFGENKGWLKKHTTTKLHDWTFSRQRYWGEPFPIIYDEKRIPHLVDLKTLPVVLPKFDDYNFEKTGVYANPLDNAEKWKNIIIDKKHYVRETNTMPGSAASSWYYIAYLMKNADGSYKNIDSQEGKKLIDKWLPVDIYFGGKEHTNGHVLYARFFFKFLQEAGFIDSSIKDFFKLRVEHGMVLAADGRKMSKRWGNVINPSDIINIYGADALRIGISFMSPHDNTFPWSNNTIEGVRKWLDRIYAFFTNKEQNKIEVVEDEKKIDKALESKYNLFVKNVSSHLEEKKHNIVVSDMMIFMNEGVKHTLFLKKHIKGFLTILSFFTPCLADEINEIVFNDNTLLFNQPFPEYDENKIKNDETMLPVQINGKLRMCVECKEDETQSEIEKKIMKDEKFLKYLEGKSAKKVIYVKGKIINFIV